MSTLKRLLMIFMLVLSCALSAAEPVNLNSASAEALAAGMVGIGPAKAQAIVDYREAHGPFKTVDDLLQIKGIGAATLDKNRERVTAASAK
ncbi:MAG: helix-hairpin-helix domain-containing protein [Gammaproteobacteria bacterium]|nr:helix-hairpin-helix domain-containing protein [Gammaproteobacteria bacterium]